jgi:hypothetical protein
MTITTKNGNSYSASQITKGEKEWGKGGEQGLWFWCTSAMMWIACSEVKSITF